MRLPSAIHSLKVVGAVGAIIAAGLQAAGLETTSRSHMGKGRCGQASQQARRHHGPDDRRV